MGIDKSSFKREYMLKQHSPLMHFQHNQEGACLRATEVKPRLDRFIIENIEKLGKIDKTPEDWYIDKEKSNALKYKIRFEAMGKIRVIEAGTKDHKKYKDIFFMNLKDPLVEYEDSIKLELICFESDLLKIIDELIEVFFLTHNFGKKKTKGFGSFTITPKKNESYENQMKKYSSAGGIYKIEDAGHKWIDYTATIYNIFKSGINLKRINGPYDRGFLFQYGYKELKVTNEKYRLKEEGILKNDSNYNNSVNDSRNNKEAKYLRGLVGLPGIMGQGIKISHEKKEIDRIPSPITFKLIDKDLFIFVYEVNEHAFNQEFNFKNYKGSVKIKTPLKSEFSVVEAFDEYARHIKSEGLESKYNTFENPTMKSIKPKIKRIKPVKEGSK